MKQKYILLLCVLLLSAGVHAVTYLKVADTSVTGTGYVSTSYLSNGDIYFDANTKTLTLNAIALSVTGNYNGITLLQDGITVVCKGQCFIKATKASYNAIRMDENSLQNIKFKGEGSSRATLALVAGSDKSGLHLHRYCACTIENLTIQSSGKWGIDGYDGSSQETLKLGEGAFLNLSGTTAALGDIAVYTTQGNDYGVVGSCSGFENVSGMYYSSKHELGFVDAATGQYHTFTSAKVFHNYGFTVGDVAVTSENDGAVTGSCISGNVRYNSSTHTLILNGANVTTGSPAIDCRQYYYPTLNVELVNTNRLASLSGYYDMQFYTHVNFLGTGELHCLNGIVVAGDIMVTFGGGCYVEATNLSCNNGNAEINMTGTGTKLKLQTNIYGFSQLFFNDSQGISRPNQGFYDQSAKYVKDYNGNTAWGVTIEYLVNYGLKVGGIMVNNTNASAVTGPNISGTVTYNASQHKLSLKDVDLTNTNEPGINMTSNFDGTQLQVYVEGTNTLSNGTYSNIYFSKNAELTGPGSLSGSIYSDAGANLNISVADLQSRVISGYSTAAVTFSGESTKVNLTDNVTGFGAFNLTDGLVLLKPHGGHYDGNHRYVADSSGNRASGVSIGKVESYGITVGESEITNYNFDNFTDNTISRGTVSYDPATNTLTLDNVNLEKISGACLSLASGYNGTLNVKLIGTNTLYTTSADALSFMANAVIAGPGSLELLRDIKVGNASSLYINGGATVKARNLVGQGSESLYIAGESTVVETSGTIKTFYRVSIGDGLDFLTPLGGKYDPNQQQVVDLMGNKCNADVCIKLFNKLGIQVAGIPVCDFNASDITGESISGSASYDPATQILTLNNVVSSAPAGKVFLAVTDGFDGDRLNVVLTGQNKATNGGYISLEKDVTLGGSGTLDLGEHSISLFGCSLHINGPTLVKAEVIDGNWGSETLTLSGAQTRVELLGTIFNVESLTLNDGLIFIEPDGGYYDPDFMCVVDAGGDMVLGVVIANPDAGVSTDIRSAATAATAGTYDLQGRKLEAGQQPRGITIVKQADGTVRKVRF